jgi:hypothetical protein
MLGRTAVAAAATHNSTSYKWNSKFSTALPLYDAAGE